MLGKTNSKVILNKFLEPGYFPDISLAFCQFCFPVLSTVPTGQGKLEKPEFERSGKFRERSEKIFFESQGRVREFNCRRPDGIITDSIVQCT